MAVRGLAMDFDGTVIDTEFTKFESWRWAFLACGVAAIDHVDWSANIGLPSRLWDPADELHRRVAEAGVAVEVPEVLDQRRRLHDQLLAVEDVRPGVLQLLDAADEFDIPVGIASSSPSRWVLGQVERLGLSARFLSIACVDDGMPGKPDPDVYLRLCQCLRVMPRSVVSVEDSPAGVQSAAAAGLDVVAVTNPTTEPLEFLPGTRRYRSLTECADDPALGPLLAGVGR